MDRSAIPRRRLSARHPKLIHSSLSEQSNGNGNSSGLKMNLNFPLRDFECSVKMCDSALHCGDTEGEPADVGRLLLLKLFTLCLRSTPQNKSGCPFFPLLFQMKQPLLCWQSEFSSSNTLKSRFYQAPFFNDQAVSTCLQTTHKADKSA